MSGAEPAWAAPLWRAAFRPFFLFGVPCGLLVMAVWLAVSSTSAYGRLWHGHEMVFGFTAAIVSGIILTALPSWAGADEIKGGRLGSLVLLWLAGRLAMALPGVPPLLAAVIDCALFPVMAALLAPQLWRVPNKLYLLALPGLLSLAGANLLYHLGRIAGDEARSLAALHLAVYSLFVLYILKSGVMIPVFTSNELRERRRGAEIPRHAGLEVAAVVSIVALAWADLGGGPRAWIGALAVVACLINAARLLRWRGWKVADVPVVFVMHLGIAWLVLALGLRAAAAFSAEVAELAWVHAFTVGGMGLCMTVLMTRVVLRHTGRPVVLSGLIRSAYALMFVAALLRLAWAIHALDARVAQASALLWMASFAIYLLLFAPMFWRPSLPRAPKPKAP